MITIIGTTSLHTTYYAVLREPLGSTALATTHRPMFSMHNGDKKSFKVEFKLSSNLIIDSSFYGAETSSAETEIVICWIFLTL